MMKIECKMGVYWVGSRSPDASEIYRQNNAKPLENEMPREETEKIRAIAGHHGRGDHHGLAVAVTTGQPWWLLVRVAGYFPERSVLASWCFALGRGVLPLLGYFGPLCKLLLILMAHTSLAWIHLRYFSQNLGLNHKNLQ